MQGGLSRRSSAIEKLRNDPQSAGPVLVLDGPFEFSHPEANSNWSLDPVTAKAMVKAHSLIQADFTFLSSNEQDLLTKAGVEIPENWIIPEASATTRLVTKGELVVALIYPPKIDSKVKELPPDALKQLGEAIGLAREKAKLIIIVSPWGRNLEESFIKTASTIPDILLGAGDGYGLPTQAQAEQKMLFARNFTKGKDLLFLEILSLPNNGKWKQEVNFDHKPFVLGDAISPDPKIEEVLAPLSSTPYRQ